jgi:esterase/lipase superfamily enzyme
MKRAYYKWFSPHLQKEMELLIFGHGGTSVLFFPTRMAKFYDYENWRVIESLREHIEKGWLQIYCLDSVDIESFYCDEAEPKGKIDRHIQYEQYIVQEVIPFIQHQNPHAYLMSVGCSLGSYHAVNVAFKYPQYFCKVVGMSGRYDLTASMGWFGDLFNGYYDENIYFNMPNHYLPNLQDESVLKELRRMDITLVIGQEDAFYEDNRYLSQNLWAKNIHHHLHIWEGEAHRAKYWREMVKVYL